MIRAHAPIDYKWCCMLRGGKKEVGKRILKCMSFVSTEEEPEKCRMDKNGQCFATEIPIGTNLLYSYSIIKNFLY